MVLGGVTGSGGGQGGPFQPFIGKLRQTDICYDTSEFAKIAMPTGTSASLLDNLNHIRAGYSIKPLYTPTNYSVPSGEDSTLLHHLEGLDAVASGFAGHTIQDEGVDLPTQTFLNFVGPTVTVTDDPSNNATLVTITGAAGHVIQYDDTPFANRTNLNFVGDGVTITDDAGDDATDVTIPGAHTIQDEGTPLTDRSNLNFIGDVVTVTDNAGSDATDVTIAVDGWPFDTINVDPSGNADYTDITSALAVSTSKDVVLVGPGVYVETFTIPAGVSLIGLGRTAVSISGYATVGSGSWFENFEIMSSGTHSVIIPAGTSGANIVNIAARTTTGHYAICSSGNARITEGVYSVYGNPTLPSESDIETNNDTYLESTNPNYKFGLYSFFYLGNYDTAIYKVLLDFDLSSVSQSITSCSLFMRESDTLGSGVWTAYVHRILPANDGWLSDNPVDPDEYACWNYLNYDPSHRVNWAGSAGLSTADTDYDSTVLGSITRDWSGADSNWIEIVLDPAEVEKLRNGTYTNAGLLIFGSESSGINYAKLDQSDSSDPPYLHVVAKNEAIEGFPAAVPSGVVVLLDSPEILNSGVYGTGWTGVWYDRNKNVNIKNLVEY